MNLEFLTRHWALMLAGVLAAVITLFVVFRAWSDSAGGQLRAMHNALRHRRQDLSRREKRTDKAEKRLAILRARRILSSRDICTRLPRHSRMRRHWPKLRTTK